MSTQAVMQNPTPPPQNGVERGKDNPSTQTPEENSSALGLTKADQDNLIKVMNSFAWKWSYNHRGNIKRASKVFEYIRDRQYVYWDSFSGKYVDPFEDDGSQSGNDTWGYRYTNNVIQWLLRVFQSTLSPAIPKVRWWPNDAEDDTNVTSADTASRAQAYIERVNNINSLLLQELMYLFASGNYFKYTRWVRDSDRAGITKEPVWTFEDQEVKPGRFACPSCGAEVPEEQMQGKCPQCGASMDEGDYREPVVMPVPKITSMEEVPNGQVAISLYNSLHVLQAPDHSDPSVDPTTCTPILKLDDEADISSLRASYPDSWDILKAGQTTSNAGGDGEFARLARSRNFTSNPGRSGTMNEGKITFTRCWIREWAFNVLDSKTDAQRLQKLFPNGCKLVTVADKFLEAVPEKLTDHWSWCGTMKGFGAYPPAIADPAIPFQDRINDAANSTAEYMGRLASPDVLANVDLIDVEAWNGQSMSGGGIKPVKTKKGLGAQGSLENAFFQPTFHIDAKIFNYADVLMTTLQLLTGLVPQTWGGHQEGIDTMGGQKQALDTATGILAIYWKLITEEHASSSKKAVKILALNATDDPKNVVEDQQEIGESGFKNDPISIDELQGEFDCYPDVDQGIPITAAEWRDRLEKILGIGQTNPLVAELFQPMQNRRLAMKAWAPPGMEVPGQDTWNAVMLDISELMEGQPLPPNPVPTPQGVQMIQLPSVQPEKDLYDMEVALEACKAFGLKNWHTVLMENPVGRENFLLYVRLVSQLQAEKQMANMPPPTGKPPQLQA